MLCARVLTKFFLLATILACYLTPNQLFAIEVPPPPFVQALVGATEFSEADLTNKGVGKCCRLQ